MPRPRTPLLAVVVALASPSLALADDRAAAQQLFQQGKELMRAGNVAEACPKFEAAAQFSSTPGVRLNLADCWSKLGRTASAWSKFDEAIGLAERSGDAVAADVARAGRAGLEPQLVYLTVVVKTASAIPGLEVKRDGEKLPPAVWGIPIPVDPGAHEVVAEAPGRKRWSATQTLTTAGTRASVVVPVLDVDATIAVALQAPITTEPRPPEPSPLASPRPGGTQRLAGWVTAGVGAVGLGIGTYFAFDALSERGDYRSHLNASGQCADATCQADSHSAYNAGNVATAGFVAGGAVLATGIVLLVTAAPRPHGPTARVIPIVAPQTAGLGLVGDW